MDLDRLRTLSGQEPSDVSSSDTPPSDVPPTPAADVPPQPAAPVSGGSNQLLVVVDKDYCLSNCDTDGQDLSAEDLVMTVDSKELVNMVKDCGDSCNFSFYAVSAREDALKDAEDRLATYDDYDQHEDAEFGKADLEGVGEWDNPVEPSRVKESHEVEVGLVPAALKAKQDDCCDVPKETKMRLKNVIKDIDDALAAHELGYKHNYMSNKMDDAGTDLKALEILTVLKNYLNDGNISGATTYYTSLMNILQDKIPVPVRKFLQYGGRESRPLSSFFKEVQSKE